MIQKISGWIRLTWRLPVFLIGTTIAVMFFPVLWILLPKKSWKKAWRYQFQRSWAKITAKILGVRLKVKGKAPKAPYFLVSNHIGYLDIMVLWAVTQGVFIAKKEVRSWPLIGIGAKMLGTLFIDRRMFRETTRINALIEEGLANGEGIIVFPEGTSSAGTTTLEFKSPLLKVLAEKEYPVHALAFQYKSAKGYPAAQDSLAYWGEMTFVSHLLNVMKMPYFEVAMKFSDQPIIHHERKQLTKDLWQNVETMRDSLEKDFVA